MFFAISLPLLRRDIQFSNRTDCICVISAFDGNFWQSVRFYSSCQCNFRTSKNGSKFRTSREERDKLYFLWESVDFILTLIRSSFVASFSYRLDALPWNCAIILTFKHSDNLLAYHAIESERETQLGYFPERSRIG